MSATIITPPASAMLTSLANARLDLGLTEAQMSDEALTRKIKLASDDAIGFCQRVFGIATYRETFENCRNVDGLVLDFWPIVSIVSVSMNGVALALDQYGTEGTELFALSRSGVRSAWYSGPLTVEYRAGWVLPGEDAADYPAAAQELPGDVEKAVRQLMQAGLSQEGRGDPMLKVKEVEGVGRREYYVQGTGASLPHPEAEAILKRYQRARIG